MAVDVEQPAVEEAAQAAVLEPAVGEVGAAVRAVAVEQAVPAALVAEQHEVLAQQAHRLDRALGRQLVDQRHRLPVVAHQRAALGARPDAGDHRSAKRGVEQPSCFQAIEVAIEWRP